MAGIYKEVLAHLILETGGQESFNWVLASEGDCFSPTEAKSQLIRGIAALIPPLQRSGGIRAVSHR
jgi:hypothetical protein